MVVLEPNWFASVMVDQVALPASSESEPQTWHLSLTLDVGEVIAWFPVELAVQLQQASGNTWVVL